MTDHQTRTAYHEAGQTVVAHVLGIGVERVSIVENEDSLGISISPLREGFDYYLEAAPIGSAPENVNAYGLAPSSESCPNFPMKEPIRARIYVSKPALRP